MNAARLATSVLTALALVTAAGCGGDDEESGALSKAEYREQGNTLCREAGTEVEDIDPPSSPDEIADVLERIFDVSDSYTDDFEALEPPAELQDAHDESLRLSDDTKELTDRLVERVREADDPQVAARREFVKLVETREFKRSQELARELGLDDCLDVGAPGAEPEAS